MLAATSRLAAHLRWRHGLQQKRCGLGAWRAPTILSFGQWLESLWEESLVRGGDAGRLQLLSRSQFQHAVSHAADTLQTREPVAPGAGARRLLGDAWIQCRDWRIGSGDLRAAATNSDTRYFAEWAEHFETLCRERRWVDSASLPSPLLPEFADGRLPLAGPFLLADDVRLAPNQRRLIARLDELGLIAGRLDPAPSAGDSRACRIDAPDPEHERDWAARWARARLEASPDACIGIVVPDLERRAREFRRSFLDTFDAGWRDRDGASFPVSLDDGSRLADAGLVRAALLLLRIPDRRMDFRDLGELLRSPYLGGGVDEAPARARLDLAIRERGSQFVDLPALCRRDAPEDPAGFLAAVRRMVRAAEQLRGSREPAAWIGPIEHLLKEGEFGRGRALGVGDERILDAWNRLLERFATLGEVVGAISFRRARGLLAEMARDQRTRTAARADGVQIVAPREADGYRFDAVWIAGMTSESWPPVARPSMLIPASLQRDRGIPAALPDVFRRDSLMLLDRLIDGAPECVVSWAGRSGEEERAATPRILRLPAADPARLGVTDANSSYREIIRRCVTTERIDDHPPPVQPDETIAGGTRLINLQSACPARAFFEMRLGAQELRTPPYGLDAAARGSLLHDAAEQCYRELQDAGWPDELPQQTLDGIREAAVEHTLRRHLSASHPLADTLRINEHRRLSRLLDRLLERDRHRKAFRIVELEGSHEVAIAGVDLLVRFDRVDVDEAGRRLVIDYKTGVPFGIGRWLGKRPLDLQLPLYAAYGNADGIALFWVHAERLRINGLGTTDFGVLPARQMPKPVMDVDAWGAQVQRWREILTGLVQEILRGDARIDLEHDRFAAGQFAMLTRRWEAEQLGDGDGSP